MNYPSTGSGQVHGTELFKYPWDFIHNPERGLYLFQNEEEATYISNDYEIE